MNKYQELWWIQSRSDHEAFALLRSNGVASCHLLHYLQMACEKLGKAYLWRSGDPPPASHAGFVQFMRFIGAVRASERARVAEIFEFKRFEDFQNWIRAILPDAYALERLAPALAQDGPNPEYPWPKNEPAHAPATHEFSLWRQISGTARGRRLLQVIEIGVNRFPEFA